MSITDELREYTEEQIKWLDMTKVHYRKLFAIADRIDAEHEAALLNVHIDLMDARGWIRLPKDADGEYIHIGDVMCWLDEDVPNKVDCMHLCGDGWWVYAHGVGVRSKELRHYHAPTVEDVLLEACKAYHSLMVEGMSDFAHDMPAPSEIIADFAKRLRLAEEVDE